MVEAVQDWGLEDRVIGLDFDTAVSNTGIIGGTYILLEQTLGRQLLNLACRHYMYEPMAMKALIKFMGTKIVLFSRTDRCSWQRHQNTFAVFSTRILLPHFTKSERNFWISLVDITPKINHVINYKELLELSINTL